MRSLAEVRVLPASTQKGNAEKYPSYRAIAFICIIGTALAAIRITGHPDLMDNEQQLQSAYVMDALQNHHWICQRDETGDITSKPPLYTWLAALSNLPFHRITRVATSFPSMASTIGLALILLALGRRHFGELAGLCAALTYLTSFWILRQIGLSRMDGLFPFVVTLAAWAAFRAWITGRGWIWFWLASAAATLTKAPVGLLVGAAGLLAAFWERSPSPGRGPLRQHAIGTSLFLLITAGWFAASCIAMGSDVYHKLILDELVRHLVRKDSGILPGQHFYIPPAQFLSRFLPWSLLACIAGWRLWNQPSSKPSIRRFERFIFFWLAGGMIPFCIATHQRADLLLPLCPPAALLAGRELARFLHPMNANLRRAFLAAVVASGFIVATLKYQFFSPRHPAVRMTIDVRQAARSIEKAGGEEFPLTHVAGSPYALQFYLNTMRPLVKEWRALRLLEGDEAAFIITANTENIMPTLNPRTAHELLHVPLVEHELQLISNRSEIRQEDRMVMAVGALDIHTRGLRWIHAAQTDFTFSGKGSVRFVNTSDAEVRVRVVVGRAEKSGSVAAHGELSLEVP
jgi:4-amino-4-deoxy-L-arabinose transferase-like glycosyltransferase